ncbi:beta'COP [Symbiodinium microadriaticum]|nr:beta'COP [Symbiodinium microadriaticum]
MDFKCIRVIKQSSVGVCQILWTVVLFNDKNDNPFVLSAGATTSIHVVNWLTREEVLVLSGHKEGVRCLDISAEGIIASGSNDRSVKLWNFHEQKFIQTLRGHKAEVNSVLFVPDTPHLITACENNLFRKWNYLTGARLMSISDYGGSTILSLSILPHPVCPVLVVGGTVAEDSFSPLVAVELWSLGSGKLLGRCCGTRYQISGAYASYVPGQSEAVVVAGGLDSTVRMWKVDADLLLNSAGGEESSYVADGSGMHGTDDVDEDEEVDRVRPLALQSGLPR